MVRKKWAIYGFLGRSWVLITVPPRNTINTTVLLLYMVVYVFVTI